MKDQTYESLDLKYRPSIIDDLKGQDHITKLIESEVKDLTIPKCLIFYGMPGTGKTTLSRIIAKSLNPHPCGTIEIDSALEGGKDVIKSIIQEVYNFPYIGDYKTYIIDEAHELTRQSFASLLKTLEEPPIHAKFILITHDFDKIPLNIKSRAQSHHFNLIDNQTIKDVLRSIVKREKKKISDSLLDLAIHSSGGSMRNAIVSLEVILNSVKFNLPENKIADTLGILGARRLAEFILSYVTKDFKKMTTTIKYFCSESMDPQKSLSELQQFLMDARLFLIDPSTLNELKTDLSIFIEYLSKALGKDLSKLSIKERKELGRYFDKIYDISINIEASTKKTQNKEALFTRFLIHLASTWHE
jgi:DNA polymerase III subunit gamma/tau